MQAIEILEEEHRVLFRILRCLERLIEATVSSGRLDDVAVVKIIEFLVRFQFLQSDITFQFSFKANIDHIPGRIVRVTLFVVVLAATIKGVAIRITRTRYHGRAHDGGIFTRRMIKQDAVSFLDVVPQQVAGLVVAHTFPARGLVSFGDQIIDRIGRRLGLHQPILNRHAGCPVG